MIQRILVVMALAATAAGVTGCTPAAQGPIPAAAGFAAAFAAADVTAAAARTDNPAKAHPALADAWADLQATSLTATLGSARVSGDTATVDYTYEWQLPKDRTWRYTGQLQMGRRGGDWQVRWTSTDIHPRLGDTQTMSLRTTPAPRARVNEHAGSDVLVPGTVYRVRLDAASAGNIATTADSLAKILQRFDRTVTAQAIAESSTATKGWYLVATLRQDDYEQVRDGLAAIPGVSVRDDAELVSVDKDFAPDLISQVRKTVIDEVDGKAGWSVVTVNAYGVDTDVLTETPPQPAPSFTVSLDRPIQTAAQAAVDARVEQTMMVVIQPSTGDILAVSQNKAADRDGPIATTGLYPPGSTFKIVTAAAAIEQGLAGPETPVPCPGRIEIGERSIPNYDEFALGTVPMSTAFARSCNTTFAKLASELRPDALTNAAAAFGIGPSYQVVGLPTSSGSVPPADDLVVRTEDGFGQGKVLVSPFGMALAAAAVAHGSALVPHLIAGRETTVTGDRPAVSADVVAGLRPMMRSVVTSGTAERIADQGEVYGKTGEAEVEGGSHAWFVGYRGDLAFATLVVRGGSSDNAVAVTRDMFAALPEDY
ncbi:penicillin-binding transpeptidase domain-containing protein [Skermania piniformis]|uniref:Penicillin-binding transpeptidase domain-containing protein n=1 Tax=Skermania pinensis TaxID=39122 RepID=A0ABX8S5E1_9ACTN|nr:penicillin-binding transpeptidase domain-containing protein [Skermania piniformis]QXQ12671.1 penicillin-binding transpeptidase domain-containing protein [Skermania piniformis]